MGGTTFDVTVSMANVQEAFRHAIEDALHEHGHGGYSGTIAEKPGYTVITNQPMSPAEAGQLADRLVQDNDPRVSDKWGPAGAIPICTNKREVQFSGVTYTHPLTGAVAGSRDEQQRVLREAVAPKIKLKRGERIEEVRLVSYKEPSARGYGYSYNRPVAVTRNECAGIVTIAGPPLEREAKVTMRIPGGLDYQAMLKQIRAEAEKKVRLKQGERFVAVQSFDTKQAEPKVTAVAPKGKTVTRFIVKQDGRPLQTWETGAETQSAARAHAVALAGKQTMFDQGETVFEVESITRRLGGDPLVRVERKIPYVDVEATVTIALAGKTLTTDAWLFFGWASC